MRVKRAATCARQRSTGPQASSRLVTRNFRFVPSCTMLRSGAAGRALQHTRPPTQVAQSSQKLRTYYSTAFTGHRSKLPAALRHSARHGQDGGRHSSSDSWRWSIHGAQYALIPLFGTSPLLLDDGTTEHQKHSLKTITDAVEHPDSAEFLIADGESADDDERPRSLIWRIIRIGRVYILEPLSTTLRFVHLACIFLPVIIAAPVLLLEYIDSGRDKRRGYRKRQDNERGTTRWWYRLLVAQMERAGPTFIKVGHALYFNMGFAADDYFFWTAACSVGGIKNRFVSSRAVYALRQATFERKSSFTAIHEAKD